MHTSKPRLAQGEAFRRAQQKKKQQTINSAQCVKLFENIRADVSVNNESSVLFRNASPHSAFILRLETHTMCPQPFAFFFFNLKCFRLLRAMCMNNIKQISN